MGDSADDTAGRIVDKLQQRLRGNLSPREAEVRELRPPTMDWLQGEIAKAIRDACANVQVEYRDAEREAERSD